jgi:predicted transcriptional regulator YheO
MENKDLEIAKKRLKEKGLTLSIVKNGKVIFEASSYGISGFLEAMEKFGRELHGSSVADKVVGKAIALLCINAKVEAVYAIILSEKAKKILEKDTIYHEWDTLVEKILASNKAEICPFEKLADELTNSAEAYRKFKVLQSKLKRVADEDE